MLSHEPTTRVRAIARALRSAARVLVPVLAATLVLKTFEAFADQNGWAFELGLGSFDVPSQRHGYYLTVYMLFGVVVSYFLAVSLFRLGSFDSVRRAVARSWDRIPDLAWIIAVVLVAVAVPLSIRESFLLGMPVTDDESPYRFMARLIADGKLWVPSHPFRGFFDRPLMVNDGRMYAVHPLGWPTLMVPGVWFGRPAAMAAVYCGLGVPAVFLVLRRLVGSAWARVGTIIYVASPMLMIAAATELPYTSSVVVLAWLQWFVMRSRDARASWWSHAGVAAMLGAAFFIRPVAAVGGGTVMLAFWVHGLRGREWREIGVALGVMLATLGLCLTAFMLTNAAQTGAWWISARLHAVASTGVLGSGGPALLWGRLIDHAVQWRGLPHNLAAFGTALYRLNVALFGWPVSLLFVPFARGRAAWMSWLVMLGLLTVFAVIGTVGNDAFGPLDYFELAWPALVLTVLGLDALTRRLVQYSTAPLALALAFCTTGYFMYTSYRLEALETMAQNTGMAIRQISKTGVQDAVVFGPHPYNPHRCQKIPRTLVTARPNNYPDLGNRILWLNVGRPDDYEALMGTLPGRNGYLFKWLENCTGRLVPIAALDLDDEPEVEDADPIEEDEDDVSQDEAAELRGAVPDADAAEDSPDP